VKWTIKQGIVFDAEALRADVRGMVQRAKGAAPRTAERAP